MFDMKMIHTRRRRLRRVLAMPLPEIMTRGRQETWKVFERLRPQPAASPVATGVEEFLQNAREVFFTGAFERDIVPSITTAVPAHRANVMQRAANIAAGRLDLLGYRNLEIGTRPEWHRDAVSGREAPRRHWSLIEYLDAGVVGDSKVVWELNRHQWLVDLAQAYKLTGETRYADEVRRHLSSWLDDNPPGVGVNWASSLEVAFRIISWSWTIALTSEVMPAEFVSRLISALTIHAAHVERYLSYYFSPNTHLTGEALALVYAGALFGKTKQGQRWRRTGSRILIAEAERQILPDGVYVERSTCYQRYTADIYLHFVILAMKAGMEAPPVVVERLRTLLDALIAFRQPDGSFPHIGDEDGGALLPLSSAAPDDYSPTFSTAAVLFRDPVYAWAAGSIAADTVWLLGSDAVPAFRQIGAHAPQSEEPAVFPIGGFVTMRSGWDATAHSLVFDCGPLGCPHSAGHGHADLLGIQCSVFGKPFLVDAGTGCYTGNREWRNHFRSTAAHSTIEVDSTSQSEPAGPFSWHQQTSAHLLHSSRRGHAMFVDAVSDAYARLGVTHRRRIAFIDGRYWIVVDDVAAADQHRIDSRLQFAPMQVARERDGWIRATRDGRRGLFVRAFSNVPLEISVREGELDPMQGWVSPNYGLIEPAPVLVFSTTTCSPLRIVTVLWPADDLANVPGLEAVSDASGRPCGVRTSSETVIYEEGPTPCVALPESFI